MGRGDFESIRKPGAKRILLQSLLAASTWQQRQRAWAALDACLAPGMNAWMEQTRSLRDRWRLSHGADLDVRGRCAVLCHIASRSLPVSARRQARLLRELGCLVLVVADADPGFACDGLLLTDFAPRRLPAWKAAFEAWPALAHAREVTLCDDTVLAPGSFAPMYHDMDRVRCDMWGAVLRRGDVPCLHPSHLVLRPAALAHEGRARFFNAVDAVDDDAVLDGWDTAFSLWMEMSGLSLGCCRSWDTEKHRLRAVRENLPCLEDAALAGCDRAGLMEELARAGWSREEITELAAALAVR